MKRQSQEEIEKQRINRYLNIAMGKCFHKWKKCSPTSMYADDSRCTLCGDFRSNTKQPNLDFFEDKNFLVLWNWASTSSSRWIESPFGDWWNNFCLSVGGSTVQGKYTVPGKLIHAEKFAKALYEYLSRKVPDFTDKKTFKQKRCRRTPITQEQATNIARHVIQKRIETQKGEK